MKLKSGYIKIIIPAAVLLIAAGTFAAIPTLRARFSKQEEPPKEEQIVIVENNAADKAVLAELSKVLHAMDTVTVVTVNGFMVGKDLADSTNNMQSAFCYTRQADQAYYKMGENEMISLREAYIVIAHDLKKIFISAPKEVVNPIRLSPQMEVDFLSKESYTVSRKEEGGLTKISLVNPTHASCKEYTVSFDTLNIVRKAVMRMTNPEALTDPSKDKILDIKISNWQLGVARQDLLHMNRYVTVVGENIIPAARLKDYELIKE